MRLTDRDLEILNVIKRHGALSSLYLYELTKHIAHDTAGFRKRLLALLRNGYLKRPIALNNPLIHTDFKVYILTEKAEKRVGRGLPVNGGYEHSFMNSCITANIELAARKAGYKYIDQAEIIARAPEATKKAEKPLSMATEISHTFKRKDGSFYTHHSKRPTEPDQLFGINYGEAGARFFALETDRGTEPETRSNLSENSILRKILSYRNILISGEYRKRFGIPSLMVLFVTTAADREDNMVGLARGLYKNNSHNLLFNHIEGFTQYVRTPPLHPELFGEYRRTGTPFNISKP